MKKSIRYIIIGIAIFLVVGIIEIALFTRRRPLERENHYFMADGVKEAIGTKTYTNDQLKASHCIDSICIIDAKFYYTEAGGRVEYTIENQGTEVASGYLKMIYGNQSLLVAYQNLNPQEKAVTSSFYVGIEIENKDDYLLEKLTEEEINKVVLHK